jgi:NTE family protein
MGAVVAAAFASGLSYDEVLKRIMLVTRWDVAQPSPGLLLGPLAKSFLRAEPLKETIRSMVPASRFSELRTPLTVTAVDNRNGQLVLFGEGGLERVPLVEALYASCALPLYYPPASIGGREYVDGGLRAVLPLDVARGFQPELVVAVAVGPSFFAEPTEGPALVPPLLQAHNDAMRFLMAAQTEEAVARWKGNAVPLVLVRPHLEQRATFAVGEAIRYVEEGYREATRALHRFLGVG